MFSGFHRGPSGTRRLSPQIRRRLKVATAAYVVVGVFGAAFAIVRREWSSLSSTESLVIASLAAAPLALALVIDRLTGFKFFSFEITLAEVTAKQNEALLEAVQAVTVTDVEIATPSSLDDITVPSISGVDHYFSEILASPIIRIINSPNKFNIVLVDLCRGDCWLANRLFLLAALAHDYTQVVRFVFIEGDDRRYVGMAPTSSVRRQFGRAYPEFEQQYRTAFAQLPPYSSSVSREEQLKQELEAVLLLWSIAPQRSEPSNLDSAWSRWVTLERLQAILGPDLEARALRWEGEPFAPALRYQINEETAPFVALVDGRHRLRQTVDRTELAVRTTRAALLLQMES
jgi:hypothetical protein